MATTTQPIETKRSFCRVCHAACPIDVDVHDNRVVAVRGVKEDPLFEGYTCIKGRQLPDQMHHPDRLTGPLRRRPDGTFEAISSTSALDEISAELARIIETHGPRAVASYTGTGAYQNSTSIPVTRAWHKAIGSRSFYTSLTIDQPAKATAMFLMGMWEAGFQDFRTADVLLAIGYNPLVSSFGPTNGLQGTNPFIELRRARERGMRLVVIDPRRTELATFADIHLQPRPGEDPSILAGMLRVILTEGLHDIEFCDTWVEGLDDLAAAVDPFTPAYVAERADIPADDLVAAARMFAEGTRGVSGTGTGPSMAPHSSLMEHLSLCLNVVCGRVNRPGDTVHAPYFLFPDTPKRAQVTPAINLTGAAARFRGLHAYHGEMPTTTLAEEILEPGEGQIRALIVSGGNPAVAWPDQAQTLAALDDLELLVVIDHRMTATAESAHYVIAPTLSLERPDVPHLMDRWFPAPYSNYTDVVVERAHDELAEWEFFWETAERLDVTIELPGGPLPRGVRPDPGAVIDLAYGDGRMPVAEMRAHRGVVHDDKMQQVVESDVASEDRARFQVAYDAIVEELAVVAKERTGAEVLSGFDPERFPFRLTSRRLKSVLNSLGTELPNLAKKGTTNKAYMNPDDCAELGLEDGSLVEITSPHSTIVGVCEPADDIRRGVVSMAHSWGSRSLTDEKVRDIGTPTNRLVTTKDGYDKVTGMAVQSAIPVSVRVVTEAG